MSKSPPTKARGRARKTQSAPERLTRADRAEQPAMRKTNSRAAAANPSGTEVRGAPRREDRKPHRRTGAWESWANRSTGSGQASGRLGSRGVLLLAGPKSRRPRRETEAENRSRAKPCTRTKPPVGKQKLTSGNYF
jgi:hypothetical protein